VALNLRPESVDPEALRSNQRAIEAHLDDDHYRRRFQPGDFALSGTTTALVPAANPRWPVIVFPDVAASEAAVSWERPTEWRKGKLEILIWYTAPGAGADNFWVAVTLNAIRTGEILGGTSLYTKFDAWQGPALTDTVKRFGPVYTTTSFGSDDELFSLKVRRNGNDVVNDVNTNPLHLLLVRIRHIPAMSESQ
jgi:hypothetical protein